MLKFHYCILILLTLCLAGCDSDVRDSMNPVDISPPYSGTIFVDPDIIIASDPNTFDTIAYVGQSNRTMFDRRVNDWITENPYLFNAQYDDGLSIEIQVNPEFETIEAAQIQAEKYSYAFGYLPTALRKDVETSWIHKGTNPFGGGNNNILIHVGQALEYERDGILHETLIHEATHSSLDSYHATQSDWQLAQIADNNFISDYAFENPVREDLAETFLLYLAIKYRSDRIDETLKNNILNTIPNRISYLDDQNFNLYPIE